MFEYMAETVRLWRRFAGDSRSIEQRNAVLVDADDTKISLGD